MSSPITFSGFNNIDFSTVINALMTAESQPLTTLQTQQSNINAQKSNISTLWSTVNTLQTAAEKLASASALQAFKATLTDSTSIAVSPGSTAQAGHYDIVVKDLAKAQVTASASTAPDAGTTAVASGGTLTIGGATITLTGDTTLQQLADAINSNVDSPAAATVVQSSAGAYKLVLTGMATGTANAFTITNHLTGGIGLSFTDTDGNGISGDSAADNAVNAGNADVLVNNVEMFSSSNTLDNAISGATLTLLKKTTDAVGVDLSPDPSVVSDKLTAFVNAYNQLTSFVNSQVNAAASGDATSIGRNPLVRSLQRSLASSVNAQYGNGAYTYLAQIGIELDRSGNMLLNSSTYNRVSQHGSDVAALLAGVGSSGTGAFDAISSLLDTYTSAQGLFSSQQQQLTAQSSRLDTQIADMQARLAQERAALVAEYTAADQAMSALNSQSSALTAFGTSSSSSLTVNK